LESTTALKVATGVVNIWSPDAKAVAESFHRINTAYPRRFVLGVGAGHPEHTEQYRKPYHALVDYLDELDEYGVPANQRVLAGQAWVNRLPAAAHSSTSCSTRSTGCGRQIRSSTRALAGRY
jgi:alkanesulfonate monooxygenase SsuD/methylene tetrahydromethanopterin reductase-like flavin-dependent oxidoreductase (luciferase family)